MTKSELLELLKDYSDDACIEVVQSAVHYDVQSVQFYNDCGIEIAELSIHKPKEIPESKVRNVY